MTWLKHHQQSERYASDAEVAARLGNDTKAQSLYEKAARAEAQALETVASDKPRTYSITAVSAVALYSKAAQWYEAQILAYRCLGSGRLMKFAWRQMEDLLDSIRAEQVGIGLDDAHMLVSAKGRDIVPGGAPLDSIMATAHRMKSLLYRTTEYMKNLPHRKRGEPSKEIQDSYRPWLFQTEPGSYQFAISVQGNRQLNMLDPDDIHAEQIIDRLFGILQICVSAPVHGMHDTVPDDDYRRTFLKLTRDLAPTQKGGFAQLDIRAQTSERPIILVPETRAAISDAIRNELPSSPDKYQVSIYGILRTLHLDSDWIEVVTFDEGSSKRIENAGEEVDDRIGPMVNHPVIVTADQVGDKLQYVDIELDEGQEPSPPSVKPPPI